MAYSDAISVAVLIQGYLDKRSPKQRFGIEINQKRYFILSRYVFKDGTVKNTIFYYKNQNTLHEPLGLIECSDVEQVNVDRSYQKSGKFAIQLSYRTFYLKSIPSNNVQLWLDQLNRAIADDKFHRQLSINSNINNNDYKHITLASSVASLSSDNLTAPPLPPTLPYNPPSTVYSPDIDDMLSPALQPINTTVLEQVAARQNNQPNNDIVVDDDGNNTNTTTDTTVDDSIQMMVNGGEFKKYDMIDDHIQCSDIYLSYSAEDNTPLGSLYWVCAATPYLSTQRSFTLHKMSDMYLGKQSTVMLSDECSTIDPQLCMTAVSNKYQLNLVAQSHQHLQAWLYGINNIMINKGKRQLKTNETRSRVASDVSDNNTAIDTSVPVSITVDPPQHDVVQLEHSAATRDMIHSTLDVPCVDSEHITTPANTPANAIQFGTPHGVISTVDEVSANKEMDSPLIDELQNKLNLLVSPNIHQQTADEQVSNRQNKSDDMALQHNSKQSVNDQYNDGTAPREDQQSDNINHSIETPLNTETHPPSIILTPQSYDESDTIDTSVNIPVSQQQYPIAQWLSTLGTAFTVYIDQFVANGVDLDLLRDCDNNDLIDLGVSKQLHRKKILQTINQQYNNNNYYTGGSTDYTTTVCTPTQSNKHFDYDSTNITTPISNGFSNILAHIQQARNTVKNSRRQSVQQAFTDPISSGVLTPSHIPNIDERAAIQQHADRISAKWRPASPNTIDIIRKAIVN